MESLLLKYGYALLFLGVAFEGEAVLLAAALLAQRGFFRLPRRDRGGGGGQLARRPGLLPARPPPRPAWLERRFGQHPRYQQLIGLVGRRGRPAPPRQPLRLRPAHRHPRGVRRPRHGGRGLHAARPPGRSSGPCRWPPSASSPGGRSGRCSRACGTTRRGSPSLLVVAVAAFLGSGTCGAPSGGASCGGPTCTRWCPSSSACMGVLNLLSAIWPREPAVMRDARAVAPPRGDAAQPRRSCSSRGWRSSRSRATSAGARPSRGGSRWSRSRSRSSPTWGAPSTCTTPSSPRSSSSTWSCSAAASPPGATPPRCGRRSSWPRCWRGRSGSSGRRPRRPAGPVRLGRRQHPGRWRPCARAC